MKLIFEKSVAGRRCATFFDEYDCTERPVCRSKTAALNPKFLRKVSAELPEIAEVDLVRHFMELSRNCAGVDNIFYPLGSCTMKYSPKVNELCSKLPGFTEIHPLQPESTVCGVLSVIGELNTDLCDICGMDGFSLAPAAGAQGEYVGLLLIKAFHGSNTDTCRDTVLIPDSAHGTNPASANMCGYKVKTVPSDADGYVDLDALAKLADEHTAALMLTNPNTLGLFEKNIVKIAEIVHNVGGKLYYDGANLNAIMGITRPGDMGFDVLHLNLHKTFSAPHGGGGPGVGAVGAKSELLPFMPRPLIIKTDDKFGFDYTEADFAIGGIVSFYGNMAVIIKAYAYILSLGGAGLKAASENAVLNANYMLRALEKYSALKYSVPCMHEFVLNMSDPEKRYTAKDIAKSLIDKGIHPPTMYFPLIVPEALMFEPTETESRETLDTAISDFCEIMERATSGNSSVQSAPITTPVGRPDDVAAARNPILVYTQS